MDFSGDRRDVQDYKEIINNFIREKMNIKNSILDYVRYKQLNWCGHAQRMEEERLPREILKWCPPGRRMEGTLRNSWMQEVTTGMRERGIDDLEWVDKEQEGAEKENKTLGRERCENTRNVYINKN